MITRKKVFVFSALSSFGLVLAQEEVSSGDDGEIFMQTNGQEEFIEYRDDDAQRELGGNSFYIDYSTGTKYD